MSQVENCRQPSFLFWPLTDSATLGRINDEVRFVEAESQSQLRDPTLGVESYDIRLPDIISALMSNHLRVVPRNRPMS
jgi:hypothetical protein